MSWICKNCETENPNNLDICEVCETKAPSICKFTYDRIFTEKPIKVSWQTIDCDNVSILYKDVITDVTDKDTFEILEPSDSVIKFVLSNSGVSERIISYEMSFLEKPVIRFTASSLKLNKEKLEPVLLYWDIENAESAILKYNDKVSEIPLKGEISTTLDYTTIYTIEVLAKDKTTIITESIQIGVYSESNIDFTADKNYSYPTIPIKLSWNVENAKKVWLDSAPVEFTGTKVIEPKESITCVLSAEDEFGIKEKRIDIRMLPLPQIKSLLVPTPNIMSNLSVQVKQPKYSVNVKFPTIKIDWINVEMPKVKSLTDLGLNMDISPHFPKFNMMSSIKKVFNNIKGLNNEK